MNRKRSVALLCFEVGLAQALATLFRLEGFEPFIYAHADDLVDGIRTTRPAFVTLAPGKEGCTPLSAARALRDLRLGIPRIVLVNKGTPIPSVTKFMRLGAFEVFELPLASEALLETMRNIVRRDIRVVVSKEGVATEVQGWSALTDREIEVVHHICDGLSNKQVAQVLGISQRTVENHRAKAMYSLAHQILPSLSAL